jgi:hypothetical protein
MITEGQNQRESGKKDLNIVAFFMDFFASVLSLWHACKKKGLQQEEQARKKPHWEAFGGSMDELSRIAN